jgi:hypothetical protein
MIRHAASGAQKRQSPSHSRFRAYLEELGHKHALYAQTLATSGKYPPAEPGALGCEPLKAADRGR